MATAPTEIKVTPEIAAEHGLTREEYARVRQILGREPNITELGIFSVMWSEHCSYKSSKVHLKRLPTRGPQVVQGPGENAGVVDIGDGLVAAFKIESHNHPSYVEPFQGATTGVGGILRDIFTMGARPIAVLDSLRFGEITPGKNTTAEDAAKNRRSRPLNSPKNRSRNARTCRSAIRSWRSCCWRPVSKPCRPAQSSRFRTWAPPASRAPQWKWPREAAPASK